MSSARCRVCGLKVTVDPLKAGLVMLPTLIVIVLGALGMLGGLVSAIGLMSASLLGTFIAYAVWVPLALDQLSNAQMVQEGRARIAARRPS